MNLIKINIPEADVSITERKQVIKGDEPIITQLMDLSISTCSLEIKAAFLCFTILMTNFFS